MVIARNILLTVCLMMMPYVYADEGTQRVAVERLLKTMRAEENMKAMGDEMVNQQLQMQPCLAPLQTVFKDFMKEVLSWELMKDDMIGLYTSEFNESEINEMNTFYETPVGQKVVDKLPKLAMRGAQISMKILEEQQPKLQAEIVEAISKVDPNTVPEECRAMYATKPKMEAKKPNEN